MALRYRFGTRGSQVRILSPRPSEGRVLTEKSGEGAAFSFGHFRVLAPQRTFSHRFVAGARGKVPRASPVDLRSRSRRRSARVESFGSGREARKKIDDSLAEAGWLVQYRDEMNLSAGPGVGPRIHEGEGAAVHRHSHRADRSAATNDLVGAPSSCQAISHN